MTTSDTIVAISSAVGPAARIIVRASGPNARSLAQSLGANTTAGPSIAFRFDLQFNGLSAPAWLYLFHSPRSYTGEDLVEFHIPGNPVLAQMLLDELLRMGARAADPGEFTARAYFNGKMDLTAAEGVAATIAATGERELAAARQLMAGELARRLSPAMELLADTLGLVEVAIDFSEEDVTFLSAADLRDRMGRADRLLEDLLRDSARFARVAHEPQVVLVGRPNAGKSTLLNALAGRDRAAVSPVAGTTRDVLSAEVMLARGAIILKDVAGLGDQPPPGNEIAQKMRSHAMREMESADVVVLVEDATDCRPRLQVSRSPHLLVGTKIDLIPNIARDFDELPSGLSLRVEDSRVAPRPWVSERDTGEAPVPPEGRLDVAVSARTGQAMELLKARLDAICFGESSTAASLALNLRHIRGIEDTRLTLGRALSQLPSVRPELLALELREAIDALGGILGRVTPDDLLGRIFAGFCIGK
jgi:tRNA modification GTPase